MNISVLGITFLGLLLLSSHVLSKQVESYSIPGSEVRSIQSKSNGKTYELYIKLPNNYNGEKERYPLVIVNDAHYSFPIISSIFMRSGGVEIENAIVVGISYSIGDKATVSRTRDYTPTNSPDERLGHSPEAKKASGGADRYAEFIVSEVMPFVEHNYRVNANKKVFVGHSFGGLLGATILLTRPEAFDYYIIGSPSFWYDDKVIYDIEALYAKNHKSLPANVIMMTGGFENKKSNKMVDEMYAFSERLKSRGYADLNLVTKTLPKQTHLSVFPSFIMDALTWSIPK